jgi:DNA-directed RNA polymerase specialized sigma54-like protein
MAGIRGVTTGNANAIPVLIDSVGQLGTMSSSGRFKKEIKPMAKASEAILALKPVTFHYKSDQTATPQFGLIAEEVVKVNPDLVVRDENGDIYTVRYDAVNAMLLNEFLKEHRAFAEEQHKVDQQQKEIDVLKNELKEQRSLIQKVSDKVELNQPAARVVLRGQ